MVRRLHHQVAWWGLLEHGGPFRSGPPSTGHPEPGAIAVPWRLCQGSAPPAASGTKSRPDRAAVLQHHFYTASDLAVDDSCRSSRRRVYRVGPSDLPRRPLVPSRGVLHGRVILLRQPSAWAQTKNDGGQVQAVRRRGMTPQSWPTREPPPAARF